MIFVVCFCFCFVFYMHSYYFPILRVWTAIWKKYHTPVGSDLSWSRLIFKIKVRFELGQFIDFCLRKRYRDGSIHIYQFEALFILLFICIVRDIYFFYWWLALEVLLNWGKSWESVCPKNSFGNFGHLGYEIW